MKVLAKNILIILPFCDITLREGTPIAMVKHCAYRTDEGMMYNVLTGNNIRLSIPLLAEDVKDVRVKKEPK